MPLSVNRFVDLGLDMSTRTRYHNLNCAVNEANAFVHFDLPERPSDSCRYRSTRTRTLQCIGLTTFAVVKGFILSPSLPQRLNSHSALRRCMLRSSPRFLRTSFFRQFSPELFVERGHFGLFSHTLLLLSWHAENHHVLDRLSNSSLPIRLRFRVYFNPRTYQPIEKLGCSARAEERRESSIHLAGGLTCVEWIWSQAVWNNSFVWATQSI